MSSKINMILSVWSERSKQNVWGSCANAKYDIKRFYHRLVFEMSEEEKKSYSCLMIFNSSREYKSV